VQIANLTGNLQNRSQGGRGGTPEILYIMMLYWFEPVLYLDPVSTYPETTEMPRYFVVFADNVGDSLTFRILRSDLSTVPRRSVPRSAADANHLNKRVKFKPDVQGRLDPLDNRTRIIGKNRHPRSKARDIKNDVSTRTISKISYLDQNAGVTTGPLRCKVHTT
jgi:hypothetical protein